MTRRNGRISWALSLALLTIPAVAGAADARSIAQLVKGAYPTLTTGALASARLTELPVGTVLQSGRIKITQKDLDAEIG
jgi:hypothetical protein